MDGSTDACYRYTMPTLIIKHEGSNKMKKTVLQNLTEVSRAIGRPEAYLLVFFVYANHSSSGRAKDHSKASLSGHHSHAVLQQQVLDFIREFVMCKHCGNPETICSVEGSKKRKMVILVCKGCGGQSQLDTDDKIAKHMAAHPQADDAVGDAQPNAGSERMICIDRIVDDALEKKTGRGKCLGCGHSTRKSVCSKCGVNLTVHPDRSNSDEFNSDPVAQDKGFGKPSVPSASNDLKGRTTRKVCCPNQSCGHRTSKPTCGKCGADMRLEQQSGSVQASTSCGSQK